MLSTLNIQLNRMENALFITGISKGNKVLMVMTNQLALDLMFWSAAKTCNVTVPVSTLLQDVGLKRYGSINL
jgi:hypothetical protein